MSQLIESVRVYLISIFFFAEKVERNSSPPLFDDNAMSDEPESPHQHVDAKPGILIYYLFLFTF